MLVVVGNGQKTIVVRNVLAVRYGMLNALVNKGGRPCCLDRKVWFLI